MKKFLLGILCVAAFISFPVLSLQVHAKSNMNIHQGIYIGSTDVSGMSQSEAASAIEEKINAALAASITLECVGENYVSITPADLGMVWKNKNVVRDALELAQVGNVVSRYKEIKDLQRDKKVFPLILDFDKELIRTIIEEQCDIFDQEAIDVSLKRIDGEFELVDGQDGIILDNENAKSYLYDYLCNEWDGQDASIELPTLIDQPRGGVEELSAIKDVLGTFTTSYSTSGAARSANVVNGCRLVNGITLYPGDTFSMYDAIKPFSVENGYYMAGSYLNGMVVDSLGGGICQVSTTLYNAVLRSELEIVERNNHSMIVSYVSASADAAISESSGKDFKFINNTEYPIYIEGITTPDKHVTFNIYGVETRPENREVLYQSEILETIHPTTENIIQTAAQPVGFSDIQSAHIGYKARLWKIVKVDGVEESREVVNKSNYTMVPRTITVGVATDNPEAYNQIQSAIATGSIDQVKAVSDAWAAHNAAQAQQNAQPQENNDV